MGRMTRQRERDAVARAIAETDWKAVAEDRAKTELALRDEIERLRASQQAVVEQRNTAERGLVAMTAARDQLQEDRREALDLLRHMQAEAMYWRGVACGMNPEHAAAAEIARRGLRTPDAAERMDAGADRPTGRVMEALYPKTYRGYGK